MMTPWFSSNYSWIFGTVVGVGCALFGTLLGVLGPRGKGQRLVLALMWTLLIGSIGLLITGLVALASGQPYGVWYGLLLAGFIGTIVIAANFWTVKKVYRMAEERRMVSRDL